MTTALDAFDGITQLNVALRDRKVSATELAQQLLTDIEANASLNAFIDVNPELTLAQAREADDWRAKNPDSFLAGIPLAHKDLFVTQGWRTTAGSRMLDNYVSPFDAAAVESLRQAQTVCLGKVSCDEFGMGSGNEHTSFGPVRNPWDHDVVPGGSSGGSAAAVAAGLAMAATGTDTGGSTRLPSAFCGISGIRPTYGVVSRYGMIAYASSLDQAGMFARHAQDLAHLVDTISGFDDRDATCVQTCAGQTNAPGRILSQYQQQMEQADTAQPLKGLRIGIPKEYFAQGLDTGVAQAVDNAITELTRLGATRVDIELPNTELCIPAYYVIGSAEASSNLSRYDAVRFGYRAEDYDGLEQMQARSRAQAFGDEVRKRIMIGTYVLSHGYYDAFYVKAQQLRQLITQDFRRALTQDCDLIVGPVSPTVAPAIGHQQDNPLQEWLGDIYTLGVNLAGLPAMSIPCGFAKGHKQQSLPVGLQLIGPHFEEARLLSTATHYQNATDWHLHRPGVTS